MLCRLGIRRYLCFRRLGVFDPRKVIVGFVDVADKVFGAKREALRCAGEDDFPGVGQRFQQDVVEGVGRLRMIFPKLVADVFGPFLIELIVARVR